MGTKCFGNCSRIFLITWGYIKLILLLIASVLLFLVLLVVFTLYSEHLIEMIFASCVVISYPIAIVFNIVLISAAYMRATKVLTACYYYLIFELVMVLLITPWVVAHTFGYDISLTYINTRILLYIGVMMVLLLVQGILSILMVDSELKKLANDRVSDQEAGYGSIRNDNEAAAGKAEE